MKRLLTLLLCITCLQGMFANMYIAENDTVGYIPPMDTTTYIPPIDTTLYEPLDTGKVVIPDTPSQSTVYVPVIQEGDNVNKYPHNPVRDETAKQEFTMAIKGDYLHIKGTLMARGYKDHYIHCQILGDSVHLQRFDMDPQSTDMMLHNVNIYIPGFTEDYYRVTLAEQYDVPLYKQYMVTSRAVTKVADLQPIPSWVGAFWSYTDYMYNEYSFTRYTVLDEPEVIEGKTYYPLVEFKESSYEKGKELNRWNIRQEGKQVYVRKENYSFPEFTELPQLKEFGNEYLLYDFDLKIGDEFAKYGNESITLVNDQILNSRNGQIFRWYMLSGNDERGWLEGIGGLEHLIVPCDNESLNCACSSILNYFRSADGTVEYINAYDDKYLGFRSDDEAVYSITGVKSKAAAQIQAIGSTISCASPTATKLEIYTMDAVKVGEAAFASGEATVKVGKTPATYLYIVTYPNGRRESGKVAIGH